MRSTGPGRGPSERARMVASARRALMGGPPVFVPASPRDLAEESGLTLENILLMVGERELEEYRDAVDRRNAARLEIALVEWQRAWEAASGSGSREWSEAEMERLDRASSDCVWLSRLVAARRHALDPAIQSARARRAWLQRARRGLDLVAMIRELVARSVDPRARPSAEAVRLARQVVDYRVRRAGQDVETPAPVGDERSSALVRRLALFGDSDRRADALATYTLLHELARRGVAIQVDDSEPRAERTPYRVWYGGNRVWIQSADLGRSRVPLEAAEVPDLFESPPSVHLIALCLVATLELDRDRDTAAA